MDFIQVMQIHQGSDGGATRELYAALMTLGERGAIAVNLFRADKASAKAKVYRGGERGRGSYRRVVYEKKNWAIDNLCRLLASNAAMAGIRAWGWSLDEAQPVYRHVLYVDLPTGQVSFHAGDRGEGPAYPGTWDERTAMSATRISRWVVELLKELV